MTPKAIAAANSGNLKLNGWKSGDEVDGMGSSPTPGVNAAPKQLFSPSSVKSSGYGQSSKVKSKKASSVSFSPTPEREATATVEGGQRPPQNRTPSSSLRSPNRYQVPLLNSATKAREEAYSPYLKNEEGKIFELTNAQARELRHARFEYYDMVRRKQQADILALTSSASKNKLQIVLDARHDPTTPSHVVHTPLEVKFMREVLEFEGKIRGLEIEKKTREYFSSLHKDHADMAPSSYSHVVSRETTSAMKKARQMQRGRAEERAHYVEGHSKAYMAWVKNNLLADERSNPNVSDTRQ